MMCLLAVALVLVVKYHPRTVPLAECSQIYRDYADDPHVAVAFIKRLRVNDTLTVDVTTLHALDSTGWHSLMLYFGFPQEMIDYYYSHKALFDKDKKHSLVRFSVDMNDVHKRLSPTHPDSRQVIGSYKEMMFNVYHTNNTETIRTLNIQKLKEIKNKQGLKIIEQ